MHDRLSCRGHFARLGPLFLRKSGGNLLSSSNNAHFAEKEQRHNSEISAAEQRSRIRSVPVPAPAVAPVAAHGPNGQLPLIGSSIPVSRRSGKFPEIREFLEK